MVKTTDIVIPEYASSRVLISKYEYYGQRASRVKRYAKLVSDSVQIIKKHNLIKFNPKLILRVGMFANSKNYDGFHHDYHNVIELRPLRDKIYFLQLLCHEMIHSEQHYTGKYKYIHSLSNYAIWKGKKYKFADADISTEEKMNEYLKQPWEKDAYNRQGELACEVMGLLKEKEYELR